MTAFGKPAATGFGTFGQPQQQQQQFMQQQPVQLSPDDAFAQSVLNVSIFGDERDTVIAKWNYLQALWGKGKAYYSQNAPPVEITPQNFLCRFKAIGYNKMPGKENKLGLVALLVNKPESQIRWILSIPIIMKTFSNEFLRFFFAAVSRIRWSPK